MGIPASGRTEDGDIVTNDSLAMVLRTAFRPEFASAPLDFQIRMGAGRVAWSGQQGRARGGPNRALETARRRLAAKRRARSAVRYRPGHPAT